MLDSVPGGPEITWSIPAAIRSPLAVVEWASRAARSRAPHHSGRRGSVRAADRGSLPAAGRGSFATSSEVTTTRTSSSTGSTSNEIAATARCTN